MHTIYIFISLEGDKISTEYGGSVLNGGKWMVMINTVCFKVWDRNVLSSFKLRWTLMF